MTRSTTITAAALLLFVASSLHAEVHMANGIKVGEVDASSAIIWTRLTAHPDRNAQGIAFDSTNSNLDTQTSVACKTVSSASKAK